MADDTTADTDGNTPGSDTGGTGSGADSCSSFDESGGIVGRPPSATWDRPDQPGSFDVAETARRVGHYAWTETKLFEALGGWVTTVPELDVKLRLATQCHHHAWRAELWATRLPELREMDPERLTAPANEAMADFVAAMTEPEGPDSTIERLVGVHRVLMPRLVAAYTYHAAHASHVTDAPTIRSLRFALPDARDDWRDGEMLLQSLITTSEHVARAGARQAELEAIMVEAGGVAGPRSIG